MVNVIIIDSDAVNVALVKAVFDGHPELWTITNTSSLSSARQILADKVFDVVLLAMTLCDGSGLDLLYDGSVDTRVVMMASTFNSQYQFEAYSAGADEHVEKTVGEINMLPEIVTGLFND